MDLIHLLPTSIVFHFVHINVRMRDTTWIHMWVLIACAFLRAQLSSLDVIGFDIVEHLRTYVSLVLFLCWPLDSLQRYCQHKK